MVSPALSEQRIVNGNDADKAFGSKRERVGFIPTAARAGSQRASRFLRSVILWGERRFAHGITGQTADRLFVGATAQRAKHSKDSKQSRRLLSLAAVVAGMSRADAARIGGMDRQTVRDWVHRFNEQGPDGLKDIHAGGRAPRLSPNQKAQLAEIIETGPDPETDGVVRWRRVDIQRVMTLSYKMPSCVFAPYMDEGGAALAALAAELDVLFAALTADAAGP